jgi:hypothetical protein
MILGVFLSDIPKAETVKKSLYASFQIWLAEERNN